MRLKRTTCAWIFRIRSLDFGGNPLLELPDFVDPYCLPKKGNKFKRHFRILPTKKIISSDLNFEVLSSASRIGQILFNFKGQLWQLTQAWNWNCSYFRDLLSTKSVYLRADSGFGEVHYFKVKLTAFLAAYLRQLANHQGKFFFCFYTHFRRKLAFFR